MKQIKRLKFDVAVIGGGPAGMMAAGKAAELGASVVLIDKNKNLGKKLLLTGKARCNLTNAEFHDKEFIKNLGKNGQFLFSALAAFGPEEVIIFFKERGLPIKIERGKRAFPVSDKSQSILDVLSDYLEENNVETFFEKIILGFNLKNGKIESVRLGKETIYADSFVLCTGGKSYPSTGSTGNGYKWAQEMGHNIIKPVPALVPITIKEDWVKNLQGLSLKNVEIGVFCGDKKVDSRFGDMLFTHFGLSGPIILDLSKKIGELLKLGDVLLRIDLKPALNFEMLDKRLQRDFEKNSNKNFKNYLPELLPQKLVNSILKFSGISGEIKLNSITREERLGLAALLKGVKLTATGLMGFDQAIITSGGVDLKEVDSKTMCSKIVPNLFFAGEILDLDGPTGGFNLQICWSTGFAAGSYAGYESQV